MKNVVIIAAGGSGSRLNVDGGKQFLVLAGIPVVIRSIMHFQQNPLIDEIIIVTSEHSIPLCDEYCMQYGLSKVIQIVSSGPSRQESVANALNVISGATNVLIHDGARPLMNPKFIDKVIDALTEFDGAIVAIPVTDTIKIVSSKGLVTQTCDRSSMVAVQTPQGFRSEILSEAYKLPDKHRFTDDSSMVESIGGKVTVIPGEPENIKITYQPDIVVAERILASRV